MSGEHLSQTETSDLTAPPVLPEGTTRRPILSDKAFPPPWVAGGLIALTILFNLIAGLKVVHLEEERNGVRAAQIRVEADREALQRDVERHREILTSLPELDRRAQELGSRLATLQGEADREANRLEGLRAQAAASERDFRAAQAARNEAEAAQTAARNEMGALRGKIDTGRKDLSTLQNDFARLSESQREASDRVHDLEKNRSILEGQVAALKTEKETLTATMQTLVSEQGKLQTLSQRLDSLAGTLEGAKGKADTALEGLSGGTKQLASINTSFESRVAALEAATKTIQGLGQRTQADMAELAKVVPTLTQGGQQLQAAAGKAETGAKRLDTIANGTGARLATSAEKLEAQVGTIEKGIGRLDGGAQAMITTAENLGKTATDLQHSAQEIQQTKGMLADQSRGIAATIQNATKELGRLSLPVKEFESAAESARRQTGILDGAVKSALEALAGLSSLITTFQKELQRNTELLRSAQTVPPSTIPATPTQPEQPQQ